MDIVWQRSFKMYEGTHLLAKVMQQLLVVVLLELLGRSNHQDKINYKQIQHAYKLPL